MDLKSMSNEELKASQDRMLDMAKRQGVDLNANTLPARQTKKAILSIQAELLSRIERSLTQPTESDPR